MGIATILRKPRQKKTSMQIECCQIKILRHVKKEAVVDNTAKHAFASIQSARDGVY